MSICLGNLSINDLEHRTGYVFTSDDKDWLTSHRQDNADVKCDSDKFHIFDIPFAIYAGEKIGDYLLDLLKKYETISHSKQILSYAVIHETDEEKAERLKKELAERDWQEKLNNPNSVWNVKWHMLVPVVVNNRTLQYSCFINTYIKGRDNIPEIIDGSAYIEMCEDGLHGRFTVSNTDKYDNANRHPEWNFVIGCGYILDNNIHYCFDRTDFSISDAIRSSIAYRGYSKEIHFSHIESVGDDCEQK